MYISTIKNYNVYYSVCLTFLHLGTLDKKSYPTIYTITKGPYSKSNIKQYLCCCIYKVYFILYIV